MSGWVRQKSVVYDRQRRLPSTALGGLLAELAQRRRLENPAARTHGGITGCASRSRACSPTRRDSAPWFGPFGFTYRGPQLDLAELLEGPSAYPLLEVLRNTCSRRSPGTAWRSGGGGDQPSAAPAPQNPRERRGARAGTRGAWPSVMRSLLAILLALAAVLSGPVANAQAPSPSPASPYGGYSNAPPAYAPPYARPVVFVDREEQTQRRSPAMMITGFSMTGVGVGLVATGAFFYVVASSTVYAVDCFDCGGGYGGGGSEVAAPVAMMIGGGVMVAVGLPLGIVGAMKRPVDRSAGVPDVSVGLGSARLRWAF